MLVRMLVLLTVVSGQGRASGGEHVNLFRLKKTAARKSRGEEKCILKMKRRMKG